MEAEIQFSAVDFKIRLMTESDFESMSDFSCGIKEIDNFFRYEVRDCVRHHYLSSYIVYLDTGRVIAAFTLMNDAMTVKDSQEKEDFIDDLRFEIQDSLVDFFTRQSSYPAINIGHIGVACDYQHLGIGSAILDFVTTTFANYRQAGCQFVTVDALNNSHTTRFYTSNQFMFQTDRDFCATTRRMYRIIEPGQ